jgi:thiol-disulfide isomerase/thioredoxin
MRRISLFIGLTMVLACGKESTTPSRSASPIVTAVGTQASQAPSAPASAEPTSTASLNAPATAMPQAPALAGGPRVILPPAEGDVQTIVRALRVKAIEEKRVLVVYIGADWCPPCVRFHQGLDRKELDAKFSNVTFLKFDLDKDGQRLIQAGYGSKFIPYFVLPGPDGKKKEAFQVDEVRNKELAMQRIIEGLSAFVR